MAQVGLVGVGHAFALIESSGGGGQLVGVQPFGLVCFDEAGRGLGDRVEGRVAACGADGPEAGGRIVVVARVESSTHEGGHVGADLAFAPFPGFGGELVDDQDRVAHRDRSVVGARVGDDHGVVGVVQRHAVPPSRHQHVPARPAWNGSIRTRHGRTCRSCAYARTPRRTPWKATP